MIKIEILGVFLLPRIRTQDLGSHDNHPGTQFHTDNLKILLQNYKECSGWLIRALVSLICEPSFILYKLYISPTLDAFCLLPNASTDTIDIIFTAKNTFQLSFFTSFSTNQVQFRNTKFFLFRAKSYFCQLLTNDSNRSMSRSDARSKSRQNASDKSGINL